MTSNEFIVPKCDCCNTEGNITIDTDDGPVIYSPICSKFRQELAKKQRGKYITKVQDVLEDLNKDNDK